MGQRPSWEFGRPKEQGNLANPKSKAVPLCGSMGLTLDGVTVLVRNLADPKSKAVPLCGSMGLTLDGVTILVRNLADPKSNAVPPYCTVRLPLAQLADRTRIHHTRTHTHAHTHTHTHCGLLYASQHTHLHNSLETAIFGGVLTTGIRSSNTCLQFEQKVTHYEYLSAH